MLLLSLLAVLGATTEIALPSRGPVSCRWICFMTIMGNSR